MTRIVPVLRLQLREILGKVRVTVREGDLAGRKKQPKPEAARQILQKRSLAGVSGLISGGASETVARRIRESDIATLRETPSVEEIAGLLANIGKQRSEEGTRPCASLLEIAEAAGSTVPKTVKVAGGLDENQFSALWTGLPEELLRNQLEGHFTARRFWSLSDRDCSSLYSYLPSRLQQSLAASPAIIRIINIYYRRELAGAAPSSAAFPYIVRALQIPDEELLPLANELVVGQPGFYDQWVRRLLGLDSTSNVQPPVPEITRPRF